MADTPSGFPTKYRTRLVCTGDQPKIPVPLHWEPRLRDRWLRVELMAGAVRVTVGPQEGGDAD